MSCSWGGLLFAHGTSVGLVGHCLHCPLGGGDALLAGYIQVDVLNSCCAQGQWACWHEEGPPPVDLCFK
jgi:hypothetical protein